MRQLRAVHFFFFTKSKDQFAMSTPDNASCARLKTAIAFESNNILGMSERYLKDASEYHMQRIPQGQFDETAGVDPRHIRYSSAPLTEHGYEEILTHGQTVGTMESRGCDGAETDLAATVDDKGAFGCHIPPGSRIRGGYDEFRRTMKGKAWETEPFCAFDLMLKGPGHARAFVEMLRRDLPRRGKEGFCYALERNVMDSGKYNLAIHAGFQLQEGGFYAPPTGVLEIGYLKRLRSIVVAEGWTGPFEIEVSREALAIAVQNWKADHNLTINTNPVSNDGIGLEGREVVEFEGIHFVITDLPTRGYLRVTPTGHEFVRVLPTQPKVGTGAGVVTETNPDYWACRTVCDGITYELYEVAWFIHSTFAVREALGAFGVAGVGFDAMQFNFQVNLIDGPYLDCNEDNFKGKFRILHAYAFSPRNPELGGAILYRAQPDIIRVHEPTCETETLPAESEVVPAQPVPPTHDACSEVACDECDDYETPVDPSPTEDEPCPENGAGTLTFLDCGPVATTKGVGSIFVTVERVGGTSGGASVRVDTADDTAADGVDYTAVAAEFLYWGDGEGGQKTVEIDIDPTGLGAGLIFDVNLTNAVGAAIGGCGANLQVEIN